MGRSCQVHEHLTCLSMTSDHYQGNCSFIPFATKGWPHFSAMQSLIHKMTKGTHAYRGTQLETQTPAPEPIVLTLTSEPVILTPSSSKPVFSSLNDTVASSSTSSNKRVRNTPSTLSLIYGLQTTIQDFSTQVYGALTQPPPQHVASQTPMIQHLLRSVTSSASSKGGAWLSQPELLEVLDLFRDSSTVSTMYVMCAEEGEELSHEWLWRQLEQVRKKHVSGPGGSQAL
jgi:hypothetical protein